MNQDLRMKTRPQLNSSAYKAHGYYINLSFIDHLSFACVQKCFVTSRLPGPAKGKVFYKSVIIFLKRNTEKTKRIEFYEIFAGLQLRSS